MKKTLEEIKRILNEQEPYLKQKYGVLTVGVFGSYSRDEANDNSDLDILIEFDEIRKIGLLEFISIENYLSDILGIKVDLVEKSALKPRLGRRILEEVIYP